MEKKHKHLLVIGRAFEGEDFCYAYKNLTATQAIKEFNKEVQDLYGKGRSSIIEAGGWVAVRVSNETRANKF